MATKRSAPQVHPSRQDQVPGEPKRKRQKPDHGTKSFKKAHPINELKSQVRSLKRLLVRNENLPATVRVEKERELQSVQHELEQTQFAKRRQDMISRYHKIRFFDRQKATKRLKRARKALGDCADDGEERQELTKRVKEAEVDLNYALYFPLDEPYVSLFPSRRKPEKGEGGEEENDESTEDGASAEQKRQGDAKMWQQVRQCMADGTLKALRNRKLTRTANAEEDPIDMVDRKASTESSISRKSLSTFGRNAEPESDEEGGGAFFE